MTKEETLIILKPDAVKRKLMGRILQRIEDKNYDIDYMQMKTLTLDDLNYHYAEHTSKPFFPSLIEYMTSGPVIIMVVSGESVIEGMRKLSGATNPLEAEAGSIRGTFALTKGENLIHSSDSTESAKREINYFVNNIKEN